MAYWCRNGCDVNIKYLGNGDWKCPKCGTVIAFGKPDDDDSESLGVYDAALI